MIIELNGFKETVPDGLTVRGLIDWAKEGDPDLIVEVNGQYVYPTAYNNRRIAENDTIEFINPNLGG